VSRHLRVLIVDDEAPASQRLRRLVDELDDTEVCGCESDPRQVEQRCRDLRPDVVLLDVEMPGMNGVELAGRLRELAPAPAVVFVTAFEQYAVDAFELAAVDYLVKPVRSERLARALRRARDRAGDDGAALISRIGDRTITVPIGDVRALVAEDKYTLVYYPDGLALVEDSLVSLEERFPDRFVRVHRKALVARSALRGLHRDAEGQERVDIDDTDYCPPVSRRNLPAVRRLLRHED
jgi:two-component system, LytTR family, response regulator AlgR